MNSEVKHNMESEIIGKNNMNGIDRMAVRLLTRSLVAGGSGSIRLNDPAGEGVTTYTAAVQQKAGYFITTIRKNRKLFAIELFDLDTQRGKLYTDDGLNDNDTLKCFGLRGERT